MVKATGSPAPLASASRPKATSAEFIVDENMLSLIPECYKHSLINLDCRLRTLQPPSSIHHEFARLCLADFILVWPVHAGNRLEQDVIAHLEAGHIAT